MVIAAADIPKTMVRYSLKLTYYFVLIYKEHVSYLLIAKLVMKGELKILGCPTHALPKQ